jgi:hypothetical protein
MQCVMNRHVFGSQDLFGILSSILAGGIARSMCGGGWISLLFGLLLCCAVSICFALVAIVVDCFDVVNV